jgi:hypothetical protein
MPPLDDLLSREVEYFCEWWSLGEPRPCGLIRGAARKALNLFLRDAFYNVYLRQRFKLARCERCLEVPLDRIVADGLCQRRSEPLPRWPGVKHLTARISETYQRAAELEANSLGLSRVHFRHLPLGKP